MAMGDHIVRNTLSHPLIKDEVLTDKAYRQPLLTRATGILNDPALDMPDLVEAFVFHVRAGFFTADPPGAVHDNFLVLMLLHHLNRFWQLLTESIRRDFECVFKVAHFIFVVVTHIDKHGVGIVKHGVHIGRFQVFAHIAGVKRRIVNAVGHNAFTHFQAQHPEGFTVIIERHVQAQAIQRRIEGVKKFPQGVDFALRHADLGVNAFMGQINTAKDVQGG